MPDCELQEKHDALFRQAVQLLDGQLILHGEQPPSLGWLRRRKIAKAVRLLAGVLDLNPRNWSAMFLLGKAHQRLGEHEIALDHLTRSHLIKPDQADVAREAALQAMHCRRTALAIKLCQTAVAASPGDPGLRANLALAHLLDSDPLTAKILVEEALAADPSDPVTLALRRLIDEVAQGIRKCPTDPSELDML